MVIIGRNEAKSQEAVMDIRRQTGNEKVGYLVADLSSISDTLAVAAGIQATIRPSRRFSQ